MLQICGKNVKWTIILKDFIHQLYKNFVIHGSMVKSSIAPPPHTHPDEIYLDHFKTPFENLGTKNSVFPGF